MVQRGGQWWPVPASRVEVERRKLKQAIAAGLIAFMLMLWFLYKGWDFLITASFAVLFLALSLGALVLLLKLPRTAK